MYKKIEDILEILVNKPKMVILDDDFKSLKYFIEGYLLGLGDAYEINLMKDISEWLMIRIDKKFSVFWSNYVLHLANNNEQKAKESILIYLSSYVKEKISIIET